MRWRCRLGWHVYTSWHVVRQKQFIVVEYRKKYGGKSCAEEPWPQSPVDRLREYEQRIQQRHDQPPAQDVMLS